MQAHEKLIIDTPEQIALEFPLASAGSRFLALGVDTLIEGGAFFLLIVIAWSARFFGVTVGQPLTVWGYAVVLLAGFTIYYGYFAFFEAIWSGQTPGKRVIGLRVISESGHPIGAFDAILRNLLRIADQLPAIYAVGLVSVFLTERNQRLGDLAAGTVVVYERTVARPESTAVSAAVRYGASRLAPDEIALIEAFLQRRHGLDSYFRLTTARQIVARLAPRLDVAPDANTNEEQLLEVLVAEYRMRPPR